MSNELSSLLINPNIEHEKYPQPLTLEWRIKHSVAYIIGGTTFVLGSVCYLPNFSHYLFGFYFFTIGSVAFLFADCYEWSKNNHVGCCLDRKYEIDYEKQIDPKFQPKTSLIGKYQRAENGINFGYSAFGSFLYLVGSILFMPELNTIYIGTIVFIIGSFIIFTSQTWKLYRSGTVNQINLQDKTFRLINLLINDFSASGVDLFAGLGGFFYLIGSIYFLPQYDLTTADTYKAAIFFTLGGFFFFISGLFIMHRYFFTGSYAH